MPNILSLHDVNNVLSDVGGVVADAFQVFGGKDQLERGKNHAGIAHHVGEQFAENLVAIIVNLIVAGQNFLRQLDIAAHHSVQGVANHFFDEFAHPRQVHIRLDAGVAQNPQRAQGDVYGLIADAFEIVV